MAISSFREAEGEHTTCSGAYDGAIAYFVGDEVFTGDTLFLVPVRLFEGTPDMMFKSLPISVHT